MKRLSRISNNRALLVVCALGFLGTSSSLVPAHARTLVMYSDNHGEFKASSKLPKNKIPKQKADPSTEGKRKATRTHWYHAHKHG